MKKEDSGERLLNAIGEIDENLVFNAVQDTKGRKNWIKWGSLAAVMALCVSAGILIGSLLKTGSPGAGTQGENFAERNLPNSEAQGFEVQDFGVEGSYLSVNSVVILDVNPSISLTVNEDEKVVAASGLNEDGKAVLSGMDLTDVDLTVAVNAVIGAMLQKGYLSDLQNAILVSVENEDSEKSAALKERVSSMIGTAMQEGRLEGTVLSQTLHETTDLEQMSRDYGISLGKASLIQEVIAQDPTLKVEELARLSITQIALISQSKNLSSEALTRTGAASDKAYISRESAVETAYGHAGVSAADTSGLKVEFDSEDGIMVYEVEFYAGTIEYEYDIDAGTGRVVKYKSENKAPADTSPNQYIGEEAARKAALEDAGLRAENVDDIHAWLEYDDHRPEYYEVEFFVGNVKYEYEIDLYTGAVLSKEMETQDDHRHQNGGGSDAPGQNSDGVGTSSAYIGEEAAKTAALSHAGISATQAGKLKAEYDYDDGIAVYEVDFEYNGYEYEYKIDAVTGAILEYEMDD